MKTYIIFSVKVFVLLIITFLLFSYKETPVSSNFNSNIDFGLNKIGSNWKVMNDGVMGGLSKGDVTLTKNSLILKGEISLANNGGFSSIRCPWGKMDLSKYSEVTIKYRSTEQKVAICFEPNRRWWRPYYMLDLNPTQGKWKTVTLKIEEAKKYSIARPRNAYLTKEIRKEVLRLGFMTNDKKESPFEFEVDFLKFK